MLLPSAQAADADPVVVTVGSASLRASDVSRRLSAVPAFQQRTLGQTPDEIRRRFVDTVLVPELLFGEDAAARHLEARPDVQNRIRDALRRALVEAVRRDTIAAGVPESELRSYYDAHRADFEKPERIRLWRILVEDEALARRVLSDARSKDGPVRFRELAREHSVDEATKLRGGELGFVFPDGRTEVPQLAVDPALYAAAEKVRDGELVPEPVKEGNRFAVVWRRGTLAKVERSFDAERSRITDLLVRQRVDRAIATLIDSLRKQYVRNLDPTPIDALPPDEPLGPLPPRAPPVPGSADPTPHPSDRGLR